MFVGVGGVASSRCQGEGREFESHHPLKEKTCSVPIFWQLPRPFSLAHDMPAFSHTTLYHSESFSIRSDLRPARAVERWLSLVLNELTLVVLCAAMRVFRNSCGVLFLVV